MILVKIFTCQHGPSFLVNESNSDFIFVHI
jgi:hypothetical protein